MSFRYTNNLIGVLKHRLCLEAAHRDIARRTFTGTCDGIEVTCSGFGSVLSMRLLDPERWEPFYRSPVSPSLRGEEEGVDGAEKPPASSSSSSSSAVHLGGIDLAKLSRSLRAATWIAIQRIGAAKEEAHHRALRDNARVQARAALQDWYEHDASTLHPQGWRGLTQELATPWMQAVRYGLPHPERYFRSAHDRLSHGMQGQSGVREGYGVRVLEEKDCQPAEIPVGSVHPLYTAALIHLEAGADDVAVEDASQRHAAASRINERVVLSEQRQEMCRDELLFWERVEFIRSGQLASIPGGVKRGYVDQASTVLEDVEDKIDLRFTE